MITSLPQSRLRRSQRLGERYDIREDAGPLGGTFRGDCLPQLVLVVVEHSVMVLSREAHAASAEV